jgi:hypothetical protein
LISTEIRVLRKHTFKFRAVSFTGIKQVSSPYYHLDIQFIEEGAGNVSVLRPDIRRNVSVQVLLTFLGDSRGLKNAWKGS